VICLAIWTIGISWISIPIIVLLTFSLSIFSFHVIEDPARKRSWFNPILNIAVGLFIMMSTVALIVFTNKVNIPSFSGSEAAAIGRLGYQPDRVVPLASGRSIKKCMGKNISSNKEAALNGISNCKVESSNGPRFVFFGDSHSLDMFGVSELLLQNNIGTVINFGQPGCRTPRRDNEPDYCDYPETIMNAMPALTEGQKGFVILRNNVFPRKIDGTLRRYLPKIEVFYNKMNSLGYSVIYVANNSAFPSLEEGGLCTEQWFRPSWALSDKCAEGATVSYIEQLGRRKDFYEALKQLEAKLINFHVFDPIGSFCNPDKNICESTRNGIPLYRDKTHLTSVGAMELGKEFLKFLYDKKFITHDV
jgi:hypothetical protein